MKIKISFQHFLDNLEPQLKNTIAFLFFIIFWAFIYIHTDSFPAGFHLGDDFEIVKLHTSIENNGAIEAIKIYVNEDLNVRSRYRPVWTIQRALAISIFDLNFSLYLSYIGLLAVITSYFLFKFCITIKFSYTQSILFSLISLIGNSAVIWIETSDAENVGMLFLSLSLYFMAKSIYDSKNSFIYITGFYFFLICMSASKESFVLFIPAQMFLYLWLYSQKNEINFKQALKLNLYTFGIILLILIASLSLIKIFVLNNAPKYTGVDSKIFSFEVANSFLMLITHLMISYLIITGILILVIYRLVKRDKLYIKSIFTVLKNDFANITILFLLITIPQYANYYKSTLLNRYYLPFIIGFSIFLIFLYNKIMTEEYISKIVKFSFTSLILVFVFFQLQYFTFPDYIHSSQDTKMVNKLLNSVTGKISKDSSMLIVIDPVQNIQPGRAMLYYLRDIQGFKQIKIGFTKNNIIHPIYSDTSFYNNMIKISSNLFINESFDSLKNRGDVNGVAILWGLEDNFLKENKDWFKTENFQREEFGIYRLYLKK